MRNCRLYPVHGSERRFEWEWRSNDCKRRSSKRFDFFHDCMEDARSHGFTVVLQKPVGRSAPSYRSIYDY
jgi:hypothetical protein